MASPSVKFEDAIGSIDGENVDFEVTIYFIPNSLDVFLNGLLLRQQEEDGWVITGSKNFQMKEPPLAGDRVTVFYRF